MVVRTPQRPQLYPQYGLPVGALSDVRVPSAVPRHVRQAGNGAPDFGSADRKPQGRAPDC